MKISRILLTAITVSLLAVSCSKETKPAQPDWDSIPDPSHDIDDDGLMKPAPCSNKVVAHRCGAGEKTELPDNSLAALNYSMSIHAYAAECDVYWTSDNDVIVAHADGDFHVNGLAPYEHTVAEIRAAGKLANGETIPTLREFLTAVMVKDNCTKLMIDIKKLDSAHLDYVAKCAKRTCEIIKEMGAKHFVDLLCTGTNENTMKIAWGYAHELGVPIGMNSSKSPAQYNTLGFNWANVSATGLIPAAGGEGSVDPKKYVDAGVNISIYSLDKQRYNGDSIYSQTAWDYVSNNLGLFRCVVSNHPAWLISMLENATRTYDGIGSADDFKDFAADILSDPYAKRFQNNAGEVVLKTDLTLNDLSPLSTFKGVLDGGGHIITVKYSGTATKVGIFKSLQGTVKNLNIAGDIEITGGEGEAHVGGLAAEATAAIISNVKSSVNITVKENGASRCVVLGGLMGKLWSGCVISDSEYSGTIYFESPGYGMVGGLIGGSDTYDGVASITACKYSGTMTLAGSNTTDWHYAGGLTGKMQSTLLTGTKYGLVFSGCQSSGKISLGGSAKIRGGGIAAYAKVCNNISECTFSGTIELGAASLERNIGGIVAYQETVCDGMVKDCTFDGTITCSSGVSKAYYVGGIISTGYSANAVVDGCKTTAKSSIANTKLGSIGVIAARPNNAMTIKNCKLAGTINKEGEKIVISSSNIEDWMLIGSATTAAVKLENNTYNSGN